MKLAQLGIVGLGVMGANLARNAASKGYTAAVYERDEGLREAFRQKSPEFPVAAELEELPALVGRPRKILLMVRAGAPVDSVLDRLLPVLEPGDVVIDGGNSHWRDTARRMERAEAAGLWYVGAGISGGSRGALLGPSIMPGGSRAAWPLVKDLLEALSAKAPDGAPCCGWIGPSGSGHFVKMVHNGIEYGEMQLICEVYQLMRDGLGLSAGEAGQVFTSWACGKTDSYLVGITGEILARKDADGTPLVDHILDKAEQKGTGAWTVSAALELGVPVPLIGEAVFARSLSARKEQRLADAPRYPRPEVAPPPDREAFLADLAQALYGARLAAYAQGTDLLSAASEQWGWGLDWGKIALLWRAGCILRSPLLGELAAARRRGAERLLSDPDMAAGLRAVLPAWRRTTAEAIRLGIPAPALTAGLSWLDGCAAAVLPANLLQAQRDCFGAHTYRRVDRSETEVFHTQWTDEV